jgi:hypothetical protein
MTKILNIYIVFCLTMLANFGASAAETEKYRIEFLGGATIEFAEVKNLEGGAIEVSLFDFRKSRDGKIFVDVYESEGGSAPKIESVFVSGRAPRKLFVIVDWAADIPSIRTGGTLYQVYVYDEKVEKKENIIRLIPDPVLMRRFGMGFDGTREGQRVVYKFKTAKLIKKQLADWGYK